MDDMIRRMHGWMFDIALPFWSAQGIDSETGRYVEHFSLENVPSVAVRRVFVICRQIYVFSHAAEFGWPKGDELARRGYDTLVSEAWLGSEAGWARTLAPDGSALDVTPDLYVLAFVLFALAWRYKRTQDSNILRHIDRTFDYLYAHMRHPSGIGFWHEKDAAGPRQQNPHMHLLEAALALIEYAGSERARTLADELVELFSTRLYDSVSGTLAEYFDDQMQRLATPQGRLTEPGHQFEWAWILANYQKLTGNASAPIVRGLYRSAEQHGVDPVDRRTYNVVRDDGLVVDGGSRCWPNTERLKAAVALYGLDGVDPHPTIAESGHLLLTRYLARDPSGTWIDRFDANGRPAADKIPTSTLYHVFLAFAEVLRIEKCLQP